MPIGLTNIEHFGAMRQTPSKTRHGAESQVVLGLRGGLREQSGVKNDAARQRNEHRREWDDVFAAIKKCHQVVHEMGEPRISTIIKLGTRTDRNQTMNEKIRSVEDSPGVGRFGKTKKPVSSGSSSTPENENSIPEHLLSAGSVLI